LCGGVQIHVLDRTEFEPYRTALVLLAAIRRLWPREFQWRDPPYEYEHERMPIDLIAGTSAVRRNLSAGAATKNLESVVAADSARFRKQRRKYVLYD
jgi:uncharacterized protein YbbC (DUF1343 family)